MSTKAAIPSRSIPVARPYLGKEEEQSVVDVLRSGWLSQGPKVAEFEKNFAEYVGAKHAIAVSSCTTALHLALLALKVQPGDEVICPSLSFIATANAIVYQGAKAVFADIDRATYNIDPARIEDAITPRTKAILLVHQIGMPAALKEIVAIGKRRGIPVVEDAACAVASEYMGHKIGAPEGDLACFSFHPRKILTAGEGGMITTRNAEMADHIRKLRQHAMSVSDTARHSAQQVIFETYDEVGYNYRMTDLQAAVGIVQLRRLNEHVARRRYLADRYTKALRSFAWLKPPKQPEGYLTNYQSYMARLGPDAPIGRDDLMQSMLERGIATRRGVMPIHRELPYRNPAWDERLPETNAAADETIILPLYYQMTEEDQDYVVESIEEITRRRAK